MSELPPNPNPLRIGVVLFPGFQALDVFGPVDCLNVLSWSHNLTLSLLSSTLDPVTTKAPISPVALGQSLVPTHTFATAPTLDLLLVPGGLGTRIPCPEISDAIAYIRATYPSLKYLVTVCTGSILASRAGVLDGKRATTNKMAWATTVAYPGVRVSAGIDVTFAWIGDVYGEEVARRNANGMEYTPHEDSRFDPFAELYGL
ncbi:uncharacterized protein N7446_011334 [Penicillium canescens]|uniref:DJ-1/PfpI domain-containing protein n=1 Tax=Penicillium canescens TaxID=5083 RepID=A0AAD6NBA1_PENCN|nr:uncharacterized protein N7446_011334 [Penicillium canescens]KAJ6029318.1 hypothetical protein N7444_012305 [Penicillium canescens]KAJ6047749.1 hypothetical protein N7460_003896 [Penicillium canescens]KAJ6048651.1 hypothetical protein N7446_011334 [Penicillium canescens]